MAEQQGKLTLWQRIALEIVWLFCRLFALLPHFIRHGVFTNLTHFVLCYVLHYRRKVMMDNLRRSFPEKSEEELHKISVATYRNLAEQIINTISLAGVGVETRIKRMNITNGEETSRDAAGRSLIILTGHYGCWEGCGMIGIALPEQTFTAVYHQLSSVVFDEIMKRIRSIENVELVEMKRIMRHFLNNKDKRPMSVGLISDQNPTVRSNMPWYKFLHQWSAFFDGGETLAMRYKLPVYFFSQRRVKTGHYEAKFIKLYDGEEVVEPTTITERYVRLLEQEIQECPELWMWTHRRWKHTPPAELLAQKI